MKNKEKKHISIVSILSIIMLVISIVIPVCIIGYLMINMSGASTESSQGYTWGIIITMMCSFFVVGYYLVVMIISLLLDFNSKSKVGKNIGIPIALILPFIATGFLVLISFVSENNSSYKMGDLDVKFPTGMHKSGSRTSMSGGYSMLDFYAREESSSTCSITVSYGKYKSSGNNISNMIEIANDEFINKNTTVKDFLNSSYYTDTININDIKWEYLDYDGIDKYYRIYGTTYENNYYVVQISDDHSSHDMCENKEEQFFYNLKFR